MKKLLVLALGMFVFTACSDDSSGGAGGIVENLETDLIKITRVTQNLGAVGNGSEHNIPFTITNKSNSETILEITGGTAIVVGTIDYGKACIRGHEPPTITIPANGSCSSVLDVAIDSSNKYQASPLTMSYKDANQDNIGIILAYYTVK